MTSFMLGFAACLLFCCLPMVAGRLIRTANERATEQRDMDVWLEEILARHQAGEL